MDSKKVSGMVTALKWAAERGKDVDKKQAAMQALEEYRSRSPNEKAEFLAAFEKHGGVKGGLGWVASFQKSGEQCNSSLTSDNANYHTRASILTLNGMCMQDFESQREALAVADQIIEMNKQEHPAMHEVNPPRISEINPLLSKYFYLHDMGVTTSFTDTESKTSHWRGS